MELHVRWLFAALLLSLVLAALDFHALSHLWYWRYRWFDIPMHVLGGATLGAFIVGVARIHRPAAYLLLMLLVSVGWEVFEYAFHISTGQPDYVFDTFHDIVNDAIGGILVYLIARSTIWRSA